MKAARSSWVSFWPAALAGATLLVAIGLQRVHFQKEKPRGETLRLAEHIPARVNGWQSHDLPLGANEYISNEVEKVLNYDDVVYREFTKSHSNFSVYVAYWGAGKMPTRMVASHTPDRCWTENGWRCLEMKFKQSRDFEGAALQPAEWRVFEPPAGGGRTYVMYWHLVDGKIYDYGSRFNNIPSPMLWWKDVVQQALNGSQEQVFIRLTSSEPIEDFWTDPGFRSVVRGLVELGLAKNPKFVAKD